MHNASSLTSHADVNEYGSLHKERFESRLKDINRHVLPEFVSSWVNNNNFRQNGSERA